MTDERDPKISQRYRELGSEEPPRELDQTILGAADRGSDRPHAPLVTPAGRHRWYYAFGAAAILALAVAVTVQVERQQPDPESAPAAPAPPVEQPVEQALPQRKEAAPTVASERPKPQAQPRAKPQATPSKPQAAASSAVPGEARARENDVGLAASRAEPAAPRAEAAARTMQPPLAGVGVADQAQAETPERWLERIVRLRTEGRNDEAEKELAEFRKRYPDYKVPDAALK